MPQLRVCFFRHSVHPSTYLSGNSREHYLPLLRHHHYTQGVQIHVASWPFFDTIKGGYAPLFAQDTHTTATRYMASEGQTFVICSTQVVKPENRAMCGWVFASPPSFFGRVTDPNSYRIEGSNFDVKVNLLSRLCDATADVCVDDREEEGLLLSTVQTDEILFNVWILWRKEFSMLKLTWTRSARPS